MKTDIMLEMVSVRAYFDRCRILKEDTHYVRESISELEYKLREDEERINRESRSLRRTKDELSEMKLSLIRMQSQRSNDN